MKNLFYLVCSYMMVFSVQGGKITLNDLFPKQHTAIRDDFLKQFVDAKKMFDIYYAGFYGSHTDVFANALCRNHSVFFRDGVLRGDSWALNMLDSSSKMPDGVLKGNIVLMGNYDQCLAVEDVESDSGKFSGQHCVVQLARPGVKITSRASMTLLEIAGLKVERAAPKKMNLVDLATTLRMSVCVPSSCRADDVQAMLLGVLAPASVRVDAVNCNTRVTGSQFSALDWFAILLLSFFGILVVLSTYYDLACNAHAKRHKLYVAFSLYTNGNILLNASAGEDMIPAVHGVRFLTILMVVVGHRVRAISRTAGINTPDVLIDTFKWHYTPLSNGTLCVDSFLLISGCLLCYVFLKEMNSGTPFNIAGFYIHRFLRITPALAVVVLLTATLLPYIGDGPFWKAEMQRDKDNCITSWWSTIFYLNNYYIKDYNIVGCFCLNCCSIYKYNL